MASTLIATLARITLLLTTIEIRAQLVCHDGFGDHAAGIQLESGSNGSGGTGLDGGVGWGGFYDVNNSIKSLVRIEDRTANPANYSNGEITLLGGHRALRFYDVANGTHAVRRPLGTGFQAANGNTLWFSLLFRTASGGAGNLANQDFFQIGFDDNPNASAGIPRVSIGSNTTSTTFPSPAAFFARSTTASSGSVFYQDLQIAAATTYLLVGRIQAHAGEYDTVSLFVNPSNSQTPGTPSAEVTLPSGLTSLSHAFIRTVGLDNGDAYVIDEWHIARDYATVVQAFGSALRILPAPTAEHSHALRWPASLGGVVLETSLTLDPESWSEIAGPFELVDVERHYPVPIDPATTKRFFRLRR